MSGLPWGDNTWDVVVQTAAHRQRTYAAAVTAVMDPVQLPAALTHRDQIIVIGNVPANKILYQLLTLLIRYQRWWVLAGLLAFALQREYGIQLSQRIEWPGKITIEDEITLIAPSRTTRARLDRIFQQDRTTIR